MKFSIILPTLALTTSINAVCNFSGNRWGGPMGSFSAYDAAREVCNSQLSGPYGPRGDATTGTRSACVFRDGMRYDFQIWHVDSTNREMRPDQCLENMAREISGCQHGGETENFPWRYRADPNAGQC